MAGYIRRRVGTALLTDTAYKEACNGVSEKEVAKELKALGFLETNLGRYKKRCSEPGMSNRPRFYAIRKAVLEWGPFTSGKDEE